MSQRSRILILAAVALLLLAPPVAAEAPQAARLHVAGDAEHLWVVQQAERAEADDENDEPLERWIVRHRSASHAPNVLDFAGVFEAPVAAAAARGELWVVDAAGRVRVVRASRDTRTPRAPWRYERQRRASLPDGVALRALAVGDGGVFALVRVTSARALAVIDAPDADAPADALRDEQWVRWLILGIPPAGVAGPDDEPGPDAALEPDPEHEAPPMPPGPVMHAPDDGQEQPAAPEAAPAPAATADDRPVDVDRLLVHRGGQWRRVALPDDWPATTGDERPHAQVVAPDRRPGRLRLLVHEPEAPATVRLYERGLDDAEWRRTDYALDRALPVTAMVVEGQLVAAAQPVTRQRAAAVVRLSVLRGGSARPVGVLELAPDPDAGGLRGWGVASLGAAAALVVETDALADTGRDAAVRELWWTAMDLRGDRTVEPAALEPPRPAPLEHLGDYIIIAAVLIVAMLMIVLFWRRDASQLQLALPAELVLASLPKRLAAGALDLAPAVAVALLAYRIGPGELATRWPGVAQAQEIADIAPGTLVIMLFVAHTLVGELVTGRSFGKAVLGLRVTTLAGETARPWQLLVRNVLKTFDLVAWLLLVLMVIGPFRQRLGDLLARTVVVMPAEEKGEQ